MEIFKGSVEALHDLMDSSILISIDTENMNSKRRRCTDWQIGIAIFDTSDKFRECSTYNFVSGSETYREKESLRFLFGESTKIELEDIDTTLRTLYTSCRKLILVGHNLQGDVKTLERYGIPLPFEHAIDTSLLAQSMLPGLQHAPTLSYLGSVLDLPMPYRHSAGNDAFYTLMALIGIICHIPSYSRDSNGDHLPVVLELSRHKIAEAYQRVRLIPRPLSARTQRKREQTFQERESTRRRQEDQRDSVRLERTERRLKQEHVVF